MDDTFSNKGNYAKRIYRGGKFLTFSLGDEVYGVEILKIVEIIGFMEITAIPQIPKFILGVINLNSYMGVVVDNVLEVVNISDENIEDTPDFGTNINTDFILGLGKSNNKVIILLLIEEVLTEEIEELVSSTEELHLVENTLVTH